MVAETVSRHILRTLRSRKPIVVKNSLFFDGRKEALSSKTRETFKWYSCGPTVYDDAHLGHARAYVSFDIIRRIIASLTGASVHYALGVTDIDDKILDRSADRGISPRALARQFEARFFEDMTKLNVLPPSSILRVTEHIDELKNHIVDLIDNKTAYTTNSGNVYFSVSSCGQRYSQLDQSRGISTVASPHRTFTDQTVSQSSSEKRDPRDFALWKRTDANYQQWESPWGSGRPGWHVECSAMAMATLGTHMDLHTGGIDLRFPHHTNELATAEARLCLHSAPISRDREDVRWSHTWLHAGHLHLQGRKMSKSVKNFITIRNFFEAQGTADGFRIFCLLHRYSSPVEYTDKRLADAHAYLSKVKGFLKRAKSFQVFWQNAFGGEELNTSTHPRCEVAVALRKEIRSAADGIEDALADDFDTPRVMAQIAHLMRCGNSSLTAEGLPKSGTAALEYDTAGRLVGDTLGVLGVTSESLSAEEPISSGNFNRKDRDELTDLIVLFRASVREAARRKDFGSIFDLCDSARDVLRKDFSVRIADKKNGTCSWVRG